MLSIYFSSTILSANNLNDHLANPGGGSLQQSLTNFASMKSIDEKVDPMTLGELKNLLKKLPKLEKELDAFASDIAEISNNQPLMPTGDLWE